MQSIRIFVLLYFLCLTFSCTDTQEGKEQKQEIFDATYNKFVLEITPEQQSAFDALNILQVNTDVMNRLYSTFANLVQPCYPPDTSILISQSELLVAMKHFVKENCRNLDIERRQKLAKNAVLAQKEYTVLHCLNDSSKMNYKTGVPRKGTWVLPSVLGRRDVIIKW